MSISRATSVTGRLEADWVVRIAGEGDAEALAAGVGRLLTELGAGSPPPDLLCASAARLLGDPDAGVALVAEAEGRLVGLLAASLQEAIHIPGRYAIVQDLWVEPAWRSRLVGAGLIDAFLDVASARGVKSVEVGLPKARFLGLEATENFYRTNGFALVGSRMRRTLK
jgi:GNAT superfamily N-acetyltransferase